MKTVKKIGIIVIIVIAIPLVVALFTKKDYAVEKQITINKPVTEVFEYIKHLKNQDHYSKWATMDSNMKKIYRGTDGTVGFVSAWDSEKEDVGAGEQEIKKIEEGKRIDYELRFLRPFESTENTYMITESNGDNKTLVKWGFDGRMDYPMNLMLLFMDFEQMIGDDLQTGLDRLKIVLEKETNLHDYMVASWETTHIKIVMLDSATDSIHIYEDNFNKPQSVKAQSTYYADGHFKAWYIMPNGEKRNETTGKWNCVNDTLKVNYQHNKRIIKTNYKIEKTKEGFKAKSIYDWNNNGIDSDTLYMKSKKIKQ